MATEEGELIFALWEKQTLDLESLNESSNLLIGKAKMRGRNKERKTEKEERGGR